MVKNLKIIFLGYIEMLQEKTKELLPNHKNYKKMNSKLEGYDYILTTNWTNILDFVVGENDNVVISHVHEKFEENAEDELSIYDKYENIQILNIEKQKCINIDDFKDWIKKPYIENIRLDVYGFSINQDDELLKKIDAYSKDKIKRISYYYFNDEDKISWSEFCKKNSWDKNKVCFSTEYTDFLKLWNFKININNK